MKVAILQCDEVLEKFLPEFGSYNNMIRCMFDDLDETFDFVDFNCRQGEYPDNIDGFDFYITTGSKASVYQNETWIEDLIGFTQKLHRRKKKLIGICFGHQIIAMAANAKVIKSDNGWGIGIACNRIVNTPDWMREKSDTINIIASHQDQVMSIPKDAVVIAESDFCPFFIVQWNDHFLSIQGHPEWNSTYSHMLINERRSRIPPDRVTSALDSLNTEPNNSLFVRWILDFIKHKKDANVHHLNPS